MPPYVLAFLIGVIAGLRPDRARGSELGGPPGVAQTGKHLARFSRVCSHALHFERACDR
jgi:hypothetical protein